MELRLMGEQGNIGKLACQTLEYKKDVDACQSDLPAPIIHTVPRTYSTHPTKGRAMQLQKKMYTSRGKVR